MPGSEKWPKPCWALAYINYYPNVECPGSMTGLQFKQASAVNRGRFRLMTNPAKAGFVKARLRLHGGLPTKRTLSTASSACGKPRALVFYDQNANSFAEILNKESLAMLKVFEHSIEL